MCPRGADSLDVEQFPTVTFSSTEVTAPFSGFAVSGDLTIEGITKPVTLDIGAVRA